MRPQQTVDTSLVGDGLARAFFARVAQRHIVHRIRGLVGLDRELAHVARETLLTEVPVRVRWQNGGGTVHRFGLVQHKVRQKSLQETVQRLFFSGNIVRRLPGERPVKEIVILQRVCAQRTK